MASLQQHTANSAAALGKRGAAAAAAAQPEGATPRERGNSASPSSNGSNSSNSSSTAVARSMQVLLDAATPLLVHREHQAGSSPSSGSSSSGRNRYNGSSSSSPKGTNSTSSGSSQTSAAISAGAPQPHSHARPPFGEHPIGDSNAAGAPFKRQRTRYTTQPRGGFTGYGSSPVAGGVSPAAMPPSSSASAAATAAKATAASSTTYATRPAAGSSRHHYHQQQQQHVPAAPATVVSAATSARRSKSGAGTTDKAAARKIRNRESAALSRKRKREYLAGLERQVQELSTYNMGIQQQMDYMFVENSRLRGRVMALGQRIADMERLFNSQDTPVSAEAMAALKAATNEVAAAYDEELRHGSASDMVQPQLLVSGYATGDPGAAPGLVALPAAPMGSPGTMSVIPVQLMNELLQPQPQPQHVAMQDATQMRYTPAPGPMLVRGPSRATSSTTTTSTTMHNSAGQSMLFRTPASSSMAHMTKIDNAAAAQQQQQQQHQQQQHQQHQAMMAAGVDPRMLQQLMGVPSMGMKPASGGVATSTIYTGSATSSQSQWHGGPHHMSAVSTLLAVAQNAQAGGGAGAGGY